MTDKERINEVINSSNMSAKKFSEHIGLKTPQILYDIIKGRNGISKELADKISAKCLNYNLAWLLTGEGDMLRNNDFSQNIIDKKDKMNMFSVEDFATAIKNLSEAAIINAKASEMNAKANIINAESNLTNSKNMERMLELINKEEEKQALLELKKRDLYTAECA